MNIFDSLPKSTFPILFETMGEGVWIGDIYERTLYVNKRFLQMSGYSREEVLGLEGHVFWDSMTSARIREENETKRSKGMSSSYEGKMKKKDGNILHVNILGSPLPEGGTIGIITDMSLYIEKKDSEELLLDAVRQSLQGIILVKNKKISSWNRGAKFIFGYKASEVTGKSLTSFFMKEDILKIYNSHNEDIEVEVLGKRKDGERISLILTIVWSKDDPDTCILLIRNITHIRKSEEIIEQKHDYLMETVREYGTIKRKLEYIQELERLFSKENTDKQKIYDFFTYSLAHIANIGGSVLRIRDEDRLNLVAEYGMGYIRADKYTLPFEGSITAESYLLHKPIRFLDLMSEPRLKILTMAQMQQFHSGSIFSFGYRGRCLGSIMLFMEDTRDPFDDEFLLHYIELFGLLLGGRG